MVRGELVRLELELELVRLGRLLKARLLSGELKRGKSFRRKARRGRRAQEDKDDKEAVTKSVLTSCMGPMVTTLSPTLDAKRCPLLTLK